MGESQTLDIRNPEANRVHFDFHTPDRSPTLTPTDSPGYTHTIRNCNHGSRHPSQGNSGDYLFTRGIAGRPNPVSTRALAKYEPVHRGSRSTIQARTPTTTIGPSQTDNNRVIAIPRDSSTTGFLDPNRHAPNPTLTTSTHHDFNDRTPTPTQRQTDTFLTQLPISAPSLHLHPGTYDGGASTPHTRGIDA